VRCSYSLGVSPRPVKHHRDNLNSILRSVDQPVDAKTVMKPKHGRRDGVPLPKDKGYAAPSEVEKLLLPPDAEPTPSSVPSATP